MAPRSNARDAILSAAEAVVLKHGGLALTLERTAEEAGISKGGLLYHFPDKDSLLSALIERFCAHFDSLLKREIAAGAGFLAAYTAACAKDQSVSAGRALVGVVAYNPDLLEPLRARTKTWQAELDRDRDPAEAALVRYALDGIWFSSILGLAEPGKKTMRALRQRLADLAGKGRKNAKI